jgi:NTE family protein
MKETTIGLVLPGGGARGAYQAGVLRAIAERRGPGAPSPFRVVAGVSAGSINAAFVAAHADDFYGATGRLCELWGSLQTGDVFETNPLVLSRTGLRLAAELSLGGLVRGPRINYLLDTAPLRRLLRANLDVEAVQRRLADGTLAALAITATNYATGTAVTFFDGAPNAVPWLRSARIATRASLGVEHVMASCALPIFFPPVRLADSHYGDGSMRLTAPLSAAIHLGADRVLAIGVRHLRHADTTRRLNEAALLVKQPPLALIGGAVLNAVFLDSLETDLERAARINDTLSRIPDAQRGSQPLRPLPLVALRPSRDLGALAMELFDSFSVPVRHLLRGLGASRNMGSDLLSYLAFQKRYTEQLLRLGYEDGTTHAAELDALLTPSPP